MSKELIGKMCQFKNPSEYYKKQKWYFVVPMDDVQDEEGLMPLTTYG